MRPLIVANWKANPASLKEAIFLAKKIERSAAAASRRGEVVVAPPFLFLERIGRVLRHAKLGAQNVFWGDVGPSTGEVSWRQLKNIGVRYVIVGHSERRLQCGETDEMVNKKIHALLRHGLIPVLCVGERERTGDHIPEVVGDELRAALRGVSKKRVSRLVIAYEPIWAISTNLGARPDTPDSAFRTMVYLRRVIARLYGRPVGDRVRIIYGGSVKAANVTPFLAEGKMQGALVGGASLDSNEFSQIVERATAVSRLTGRVVPLATRGKWPLRGGE